MKRLPAIWAAVVEYFCKPISARSLGVFRICIASFSLFQIGSLYPNLMQIYGNRGFIQWEIGDVLIPPGIPNIGSFAQFAASYGISPNQCVYLVFGGYLFSLVLLVAGFKTFFSGLTACFLHITMTSTGEIFIYGAELFTNMTLFYCWALPTGHAFSVDKWLDSRRVRPHMTDNHIIYTRALRLLQLHLAVVYLNCGWDKSLGPDWWNGESIWRTLMMPQLAWFDMSWLANVPWIATLAGWSTLVIEIGYCIFIWHRKTRLLWMFLTIGLHIGIGIFLGLWLFSGIMTILTLTIFGWEHFEYSYLLHHPIHKAAGEPPPRPFWGWHTTSQNNPAKSYAETAR